MLLARRTPAVRPLSFVVHPRKRVGPHFAHEENSAAAAGNGKPPGPERA